MAWMISTRLRADREELHDRDLLALVGPRPDVDEEAAQVVAQEPRVAAADADARQKRRRAEEQHDEEVPPAVASSSLWIASARWREDSMPSTRRCPQNCVGVDGRRFAEGATARRRGAAPSTRVICQADTAADGSANCSFSSVPM